MKIFCLCTFFSTHHTLSVSSYMHFIQKLGNRGASLLSVLYMIASMHRNAVAPKGKGVMPLVAGRKRPLQKSG